MPLIADMIRTLAARGASPEAIASAVEVLELDQLAKEETRLAKKRVGNAERQQRYRDRQAGRNALRSVTERDDPPPPPGTPTPTRTPAQRSAPAPAHTHEGWGQQEVSEAWEPRSEVFEFVVQLWVLKGLDAASAREKARSEVQRFRDFSRSRGLTYADLDAGFKEWATKHNAPHNRPLAIVNGAKSHATPKRTLGDELDRIIQTNPLLAGLR